MDELRNQKAQALSSALGSYGGSPVNAIGTTPVGLIDRVNFLESRCEMLQRQFEELGKDSFSRILQLEQLLGIGR